MTRPSLTLNLRKPLVSSGFKGRGNGDDAVALKTASPLPHEKRGGGTPVFIFYWEFWNSLSNEEREFLRRIHLKTRLGIKDLKPGEVLNLFFPR